MRVSRSFKGKNNAIVYDFVYDNYMSFYQFTNASGECRMKVHKEFTKYHSSLDLFTWWLSTRFNENKSMPEHKRREFETNYYNKYVIEIK